MDGFPEWASWSWGSEYLPESFHTRKGWVKFMEACNRVSVDSPSYGTLEYLALVLGLACRDMDAKLSGDKMAPLWVLKSLHGKRHRQEIFKLYPKFEFSNEPSVIERYVMACTNLSSSLIVIRQKRKNPPSISQPTGSPMYVIYSHGSILSHSLTVIDFASKKQKVVREKEDMSKGPRPKAKAKTK